MSGALIARARRHANDSPLGRLIGKLADALDRKREAAAAVTAADFAVLERAIHLGANWLDERSADADAETRFKREGTHALKRIRKALR